MILIKRGAFALFVASIMMFGFGQLQSAFAQNANASDAIQPPKAYVAINGKKTDTVINGYQWSFNHDSLTKVVIADAAYDPARNLKPIAVKPGSMAKLRFEHKPPLSMQLVMWRQTKRSKQQHLQSTAFALPNDAGDYIYEITGYWGRDYVQYDFEVRVY